MAKSTKWGNDAWVEHISEIQLPSLSSTVKTLENLANDDTVSLAKLGQSVLHDYALTSSILRVANSAAYMGRNQVTTVSRAAVVLGYSTIKNICITAKLLGSLMENSNVSEGVYTRILRQMAHSFHAGMLTQIMMPNETEAKKEETFIAALLHHIGECGFWSAGGNITKELDELLSTIDPTDKSQIDKIVMKNLGTSFDRISLGLAENWNLSDNFMMSLKDGRDHDQQAGIVILADKLSLAIANPQSSKGQIKGLLEQVSKISRIKPETLKKSIEHCTTKTEKLLQSYGADMLVQYLHPGGAILPKPEDPPPFENDEKLQLQILRELTSLTTEGGDFNVVIQTSLEGIYRGIGMDRVIVLLKNKQKKTLEPRFICGENAQQLKEAFTLPLNSSENIFTYAVKNNEYIWANGFEDENWFSLIGKPIRNIANRDGFFIAPVMWDTHCIGLIYADRSNRKHNKRSKLGKEEFNAFNHFTQQTNLCLSIILKR